MNKSIYIILLLLSCFLLPTMAQDAYKGKIKYNQIGTKKQQQQLTIQFQIDLSLMELGSQRLIELTPLLKGRQGNEHRFYSVYVAGRTREKVISRNAAWLKNKEEGSFIVRKNKTEQIVPVTLTLPFEEWMYDSDLFFEERVQGCAQCGLGESNYLVSRGIVPAKFIPAYELQYVTPEAEIPKRRSETFNARLNFRVAKYDLDRNFQNNAAILSEVDKIVREISNDGNLTIQEMSVVGFASPEGDYDKNFLLSKNRTNSFVNYLVSSHDIPRSMIRSDWKGEDWDGLKSSLMRSSLADRDVVIRIIDDNANISQRKRQLQSLNGGSTYRTLLNDYYPNLRRIEYSFSYIARQFDVAEAMEVIKVKPYHLSLNEMFLVAQEYESGSKEFEQTFRIAVGLFPENDVANLNAAVQDINMGALDRAIERLQKIELNEAWNNLGVAYAKKGQYEQARKYFGKAVQAENIVAKRNQEQLNRFIENE